MCLFRGFVSVLAFNRAVLVVVLTRSRQLQGLAGREQNIGSGWGRVPVAGVQRIAGFFWRGSRVETMLGNGVRVKSFETDVMGSRCASLGVVVRCVSTADSSLSLSLSLLAVI